MIFLLLLVTIACNYCVQGVRDRLLSAVLLADVAFVRQLVDDYKEGILSVNSDVLIDRLDGYNRTCLLQCGFDPQSTSVEALDKNCTEIAQILASAGANLTHRDKHGLTAISMGAMKGYSNMIRFLFERGVSVDMPDNKGRTPLMIAITHGHAKAVDTLLACGAITWTQDNYGWTAFHFATRQLGGHEMYRPVFDALLLTAATNTSVLDIADMDGRTALMYSVLQNTDYALSKLLLAGADPSKEDNGGATAYGLVHNSEHMKRKLAEASAARVVRAHAEWEKSEKERKRRNKKNKQCPLNR